MTYETYIDHDGYAVANRIASPSDMLLNSNPGIPQPVEPGNNESLVISKKLPIYKYVREALKYVARGDYRHTLDRPWVTGGCLFASDGRALLLLSAPEFADLQDGRYHAAVSSENIILVRDKVDTSPIINGRRIFPAQAEPLREVYYRPHADMLSRLIYAATRIDVVNPEYLKPLTKMKPEIYRVYQEASTKPVIITGSCTPTRMQFTDNIPHIISFACAIMPLTKEPQ